MKAIRYSLCILLTFILFSCSNEDEAVIDESVDISGIWNLVDINSTNAKATFSDGTFSYTIGMTFDGKDYDFQAVFNSNPNEAYSSGSFIMIISTTYLGETVTQEQLVDTNELGTNGIIQGNWEIDGNKLIISSEVEGTLTYTITELTETRMKISIDLALINDLLADFDTSGATVNYSGKIEYVLTR